MLSPGRAFQLSGSAGLVAALLLGLDLARHRALSPGVVIALWIVAILTFLALAMATKILTRRERLIYYHHEIAVTLSAALLLTLSGRPVLPYLDILAAGLGLFLACGRVGCLAAGCCYGRPSRRGIRYGDAHVHLGFPRYLAGVRLFPVQALESAAVFLLASAAAAVIYSHAPAGAAFTLYVSGYALLRFTLEFLRGDASRRYWRGFSEAQWTSLLLSAFVPPVAAAILLAMLAVILARRRAPLARLFSSGHIRELAQAASAVRADASAVVCTSLGLRISSGCISALRFYTISCSSVPLDLPSAQRLARLISRLDGLPAPARLLAGSTGSVFHLLMEGAHADPR